MSSIAADCLTTYRAAHSSGPRRAALVRYVVLHDTEGPTAEGAAAYFAEAASKGSSHLVVDEHACYRVLDDLVIPWAAPPLNTSGFHIEQAGYAAWTRAQWLEKPLTIERAAYKAALRCDRFRIPAKLLDVAELRADFPRPHPAGGIVTHATVSAAFHDSTHTDPGAGYPLDVFMRKLAGYLV